MAEKKLTKRKRKNQADEDPSTLTKDEEEVLKYLRFNLEAKKSTLLGDEAYYFFGSKAVDFLMDSKWATGYKSSVVFTHRESVVAFLSKLLVARYFDHVHVIKMEKKVKKKDGDKKKEEEEKKDNGDKKKESEKKKNDKGKGDKKEEKKVPASPRNKRDKDGKEIKKVKKKVKINLEPHEEQIFYDTEEEAYVWIYDPVSWKTFFFGVLLVLAIIAICLFPLWPENIREYSWYLSVAGAIFVGGILVLAVLRYIIYGILWICTMGKLHFWLLPNLTAECGFFESFVPVYEYNIIKSKKKDDNNMDDTSKDKSSLSNDEKDTDIQLEDKKEIASIENIEDANGARTESIEGVGLDKIKHCKKEEIEIGDSSRNVSEDDKNDESSKGDILSKQKELVMDGVIDEKTVEDITSAMTHVEKLENDSEGSNDSVKEEDWVKVKKVDASEDVGKHENVVNC